MIKLFAIMFLVVGLGLVFATGYDVSRIPIAIVWFALATTGVLWALAKI